MVKSGATRFLRVRRFSRDDYGEEHGSGAVWYMKIHARKCAALCNGIIEELSNGVKGGGRGGRRSWAKAFAVEASNFSLLSPFFGILRFASLTILEIYGDFLWRG